MLNAGYRSLGYQRITGLAAAQALNIPAGCCLILVTPDTQAVRWRDDGTDPTAAVGYPLAAGVELQYGAGQMAALRFIEQAASAVLNVQYYGAV